MAIANLTRIVLVVSLVLCASSAQAQTCTSVQPASDWVCVSGGWVPPGMAPQPAPAPVPEQPVAWDLPPVGSTEIWPPPAGTGDPNQWLIDHAATGEPLPPGDIYFYPPLRLKDRAMLRGTAGRTALRALPGPGPVLIIESSIPGNLQVGYPLRFVLQDLILICGSLDQQGIVVRGAGMTFDRISVNYCGEGLRCSWCVNVSINQSLFTYNTTGILLAGSGWATVTTVRIRDTTIQGSTNAGLVVWRGQGITIDNGIIEGNSGTGLQVIPQDRLENVDVRVNDTWFERNGAHWYDPQGRVWITGTTGVRGQ